jgi:acetyl-CoA carboxylase carboxyltransferase component
MPFDTLFQTGKAKEAARDEDAILWHSLRECCENLDQICEEAKPHSQKTKKEAGEQYKLDWLHDLFEKGMKMELKEFQAMLHEKDKQSLFWAGWGLKPEGGRKT